MVDMRDAIGVVVVGVCAACTNPREIQILVDPPDPALKVTEVRVVTGADQGRALFTFAKQQTTPVDTHWFLQDSAVSFTGADLGDVMRTRYEQALDGGTTIGGLVAVALALDGNGTLQAVASGRPMIGLDLPGDGI